MSISYWEEVTTTVAKVNGVLKQYILACSDWAHLAVTASTTLSATAAAGATSISVTSASNISVGKTITLWRNGSINGASAPESRVVTVVAGTTISFTDALVAPNGTYQSSDALGIGTFVKATTTRGAQMVLDLEDATITAQRMQIGIYRTHDGTTGVDKVTRNLYWKTATGATSDILHARGTAGKEHIYLEVEGPRLTETNAESTIYGSYRQYLALNDISPYYSTTYDNTPAVLLVGNTAAAANVSAQTNLTGPLARNVVVSRDAPGSNSWVQAHLRTLTPHAGDAANPITRTFQPLNLDGSILMLPFWVFEDAKGLRGSLTRFYTGDAAPQSQQVTGDPVFWNAGMEVSYGGVTYRTLIPGKSGANSGNNSVSYGWGGNWFNVTNAQPGPVLFVPKA